MTWWHGFVLAAPAARRGDRVSRLFDHLERRA